MDKAGIAFMGLILVLISLVLSILAVDRTSIEARPNVCDVHAPSIFQLQRSEVDLRAVK